MLKHENARPIDDQSIVIRVVEKNEGVYQSATLFRHEGRESTVYIESPDSRITEYDHEIQVSEYWLFDISERAFKIFRLSAGKYELQALCHLALCDGQDPIRYFPYAFSIASVEDDISDILTNDEIDYLIYKVFGFQEYPFTEVLDGKEYIREFND